MGLFELFFALALACVDHIVPWHHLLETFLSIAYPLQVATHKYSSSIEQHIRITTSESLRVLCTHI